MHRFLKILVLPILLLIVYGAKAQQVKTFKDKIILKQGSIIVGSITDYNPEESITVELESGNVITLPADRIKRVVMHKGKANNIISSSVPLLNERIYHDLQFSFLTNVDGTGYSLGYSALYQKNRIIAFGAGIGVDNYYGAIGREIVPVYANARFNLMNGSNAPFVGLKMGYGFAFERERQNITEAEGGLMTNPYFGIRIGSRGLIWNLFTGLKFQNANYLIQNSWETRREDILHRRLEIGTSVMF